MIVVTGAAGFIGSCIVAKLNELGFSNLIVVDDIEDPDPQEAKGYQSQEDYWALKKENLKNKKFSSYYDKDAFIQAVAKDQVDSSIEAVIHMGACSSTTLDNSQYFTENNFEYSVQLAQWTIDKKARLIYASSAATYGDGSCGYRDDEDTIAKCQPLNFYGQSKQDFDKWILNKGLIDQVVGLKFFNVFGPNEYHKGDMRSVVAKAYKEVDQKGKIRLFKSHNKDYKDGEQKRDFIYVKDAVDVVIFFLEHSHINGIYNVGTGEARTWNDLAAALFAAVGKKSFIEYFDMPDELKSRYQYFTQADMHKLRSSGYTKPFTRLEDAVKDYVGYLREESHL